MNTSSNIRTELCKEVVENGVRKETKTFIWKIENFDVVRKSKDLLKLQTFRFTAGESLNYETEWTFSLKLSQHDSFYLLGGEQTWIDCCLKLMKAPNGRKNAFASWQLRVRRTELDARDIRDLDMKVNEYQVKKGWKMDFLPQNLAFKKLPLTNGSLVMELTMHLYAPKTTTTLLKTCKNTASIEKRYKPKFFEKLQNDLAKLMVPTCSLKGSTVTKIVVADGVDFNAAPDLLSSRSPVFKAMLESHMTGATSGIVRITDISSKTMEVLLSFLYTGKLQPVWCHPDVVTELVYAAAKYQLSDLLEFLDEVVGTLCTKENAGKLINLARKLSLKKAENDLWEFVKKNISSLDEMIAFTKDADGATTF